LFHCLTFILASYNNETAKPWNNKNLELLLNLSQHFVLVKHWKREIFCCGDGIRTRDLEVLSQPLISKWNGLYHLLALYFSKMKSEKFPL